MPKFLQTLGTNITKYRKLLKLSQEDLAQKIGTTRGTVSRYETAAPDLGISAEMITKIAGALNVEETDLFSLEIVPKAFRIVETTEQLVKRLENALVLMEIITPENTELILRADKDTRRLLAKGIKNWMTLPYDEKDVIVDATARAADHNRAPPLEQRSKSKA